MTTTLAILLILLLLGIFGWHFFFAGAIAITATMFAIVVGAVIFFGVGILLLFILTGLSIFIVGIVAVVLAAVGIALFPVLLPIILPLLLVLLFISYIRKKRTQDKK